MMLQMRNRNKRILLFSLLFFTCLPSFGQQIRALFTVSGTDNMRIPDATISLNKQKYKADSLGNAIVEVSPGRYTINIASVNHFPFNAILTLSSDTSIRVVLRLRESLLGNVTVISSRNVVRNQMGIQSISGMQLRRLPVILGEVDPLKTITLLPGVKNGGEASAGIYVRGGGPDQNLVLLDGIPVYNPNHLLGFFSIFNGDAVKNIDVIKGGIPAEYGGRLSSVITIDTKEGREDSIKGSGGIGLISSRVSLEGPIVKGKSSFIISARRTYIDQVARFAARKRIGNNGYFFYDVNAKADYTINQNNQLEFTFYSGRDRFAFKDPDEGSDGSDRLFRLTWGNTLAGLQWKQQINKSLKQETGIYYNTFSLDSYFGFTTSSFLFSSGLQDVQAKTDWTYEANKWLQFKYGLQYIIHRFKPGAGGFTSGVQDFKSAIVDQYAREAAAYLSVNTNITPALNAVAGLRYSYFNQVGPTERVLYNEDGVPSGETEKFARGESIAKYHYPEPRISLLYKLRNAASIKASYTRTIQYLHLATTSGATLPSDLWVPSSKLLKPSNAEQVAVGYFKNFNNNTWEASVETYFKVMNNQLEFKPGAQLLLNQNLESEMIFGSGKAYGVELFIQKKRGKLTGWIGYTLSRAERTFPQLNGGKPFPYRYDRTHDLSIVANYPLSKKWEASAVFVFGTGNALTLPTGRFTYYYGYNFEEGTPIFTNVDQYEKVNDYRMPPYHRLDIAFTYTPKPQSTKRFKSSWNFGVYNVYNRANPYFIYFDVDEDAQTVKGKIAYLFPIVPSVTWNFTF